MRQKNSVYDLGLIEAVIADSADQNTTIDTISQEQIVKTNSYDVSQTLRYQSGVFVGIGMNQLGESSINIRGFGHGQIGFFLDGIPVHFIYDRNINWGQFASFGLSEISISKGYTSPAYSSNILGGAVNMVTSKPTKEL